MARSAHGARGAQRGDLLPGQAQARSTAAVSAPGLRRRRRHRVRRPAEPRRRSRLDQPAAVRGMCRARRSAGGWAPRLGLSTGATHASLPPNASAHSSLVRCSNAAANRSRSTGQPGPVVLAGQVPRRPARARPAARRRTSAPARPPRRNRRPRSRRCRRTARRRPAGWCPAPPARRRRQQPVQERVQQGRAVHHGRVDHLAEPGPARARPAPRARRPPAACHRRRSRRPG